MFAWRDGGVGTCQSPTAGEHELEGWASKDAELQTRVKALAEPEDVAKQNSFVGRTLAARSAKGTTSGSGWRHGPWSDGTGQMTS